MSANAPSSSAVQVTVQSSLQRAFLRSMVIPVCVLAFFLIAPHWLDHRLHSSFASMIERDPGLPPWVKPQHLAALAKVDFAALCDAPQPGLENLRTQLLHAGVGDHFERLQWGLYLSLVLTGVLLFAIAGTLVLNQSARTSRAAFINAYRTGWKLAMISAITSVFLLIPLLGYGCFELTTLAADRYFPQLILGLVLAGLAVLWTSVAILLKKPPLEFVEPLAREVTPQEAPELWQAVREAAARLNTAPPDHILVGMQLNFYVTELAVKHELGRAEGRTLYLSRPLLMQLSSDEALSVIGHELGHFIGEDTRLTREFHPMRFKADATMVALAQSAWMGWTSFQSLNFFLWCFGATEQTMSRERELQADRKGAELTSPEIAGRALVKFHVVAEAFRLGLADNTGGGGSENPFEMPLGGLIRDKLVPQEAFWTQLFETKTPHPLDSHPALHVRLESLGQKISGEAAIALATEQGSSAFARWLASCEELFSDLKRQTTEAVANLRTRTQIEQADAGTESGQRLLEKHFPECRWPVRGVGFWLYLCLLGFVAAMLIFGATVTRDLTGQCVLTLLVLFAATLAHNLWRRHCGAELVLRAEGLSYGGWLRPLSFSTVEKMSAMRVNGVLSVTFCLKTAQPPIWKYALLRFPSKQVVLSLSMFAKPDEILQTIHRYLTRQVQL